MTQLTQPAVKTVPAKVEFDFEPFRQEVLNYIKKYNIAVTPDNLAEAKKAAAELNKIKSAIHKGLREHEKELEKPAKELGDYRKTLVSDIDEGRSAIVAKVEECEAVSREKVKDLLEKHLAECREAHKIESEFATSTIDHLVKITSANKDITKLNKSGRDAVESLVVGESNEQNKVKGRLATLELESYRNGLDAPLTRRHVDSFLRVDDDEWVDRLNDVIAAEKERQEITAAKQREKAQEEAKQQTLATPPDEPKEQRHDAPAKPAEQPEEEGSKVVRVFACFDVTVPSHVPESAVSDKVKSRLQASGVPATEVWL